MALGGGLLPPVVAELIMDIEGFKASADKAQAKMGELSESGTAMWDKVGKATVLGAAAVGLASIKMASDFETQMTRLYTAAGAPKQAVQDSYGTVLKLGDAVGETGTAMAEALYHPVSAGLNLQTSLNAVRYSAEEAQISGASLDDTTYALSSVMKAFNMNASDAHGTMALLNAIVGQGDMRFQDFNQSVSNWAPTAAQMGISVQSMGAALAYLTDRGNSAEEAATRVTMGLTMMAYPSQKAASMLEGLGVATSDVSSSSQAFTSVMEKTGITQNQLAQDLQQPDGIYVALTHLKTALSNAGVSATEADSIMSHIFGGGRSDKAILSLIQNLDGLKTKFTDIGTASGSFDTAWANTQQTLNFQLKQLGAEAENAGIAIGTRLIPVVQGSIMWFERHKAAAQALAMVIEGVLVVAVLKWVTTLTGNLQSAIQNTIKNIIAFTSTTETAAARQEAFTLSMSKWGDTASTMIPIVGGVIAGVGAIGMAVEHFTRGAQQAASSTDQFTTALLNSGRAGGAALTNLDQASQLAQSIGTGFTGASDPMAQMILGFQELGKATMTTYPQLKSIDEALAGMVSSGNGDRAADIVNQVAAATDKAGKSVAAVQTLLPNYEQALAAQEAQQESAANSTNNATDAANANSGALGENAGALGQDTTAANGLADSMNQVNDAFTQLAGNINSSGMLHEFQKDLLSVKDTLDQNGTAFNDNSLDGLKNEEAFRQAAQAISNYRDAQIKNGVETDSANKTAADQAQQLINVWEHLTDNKKAVDDYATSLGLVPKTLATTVDIKNLANEQAQLDQLANTMAQINGDEVRPFTFKQAHAAGGPISGAGTGTSDSIPSMLSNGEYVINAAAASAIGMPALDALNSGDSSAAAAAMASPDYSVGGFGGFGGSGGGAAPVIQIFLDGQDISGAMRSLTLQYDQRNSGNGLSLAGGGFR